MQSRFPPRTKNLQYVVEMPNDGLTLLLIQFLVTSLEISLKLAWKPFERQFGQQLAAFREHRKSIEKEAGISHMIEAADTRALIRANQLQLGEQRMLDSHERLLSNIPSVDHEAKQSKLRKLRYDGTGEWLLENCMYQGWEQGIDSSYLCCHGIPGSGKSVLASAIIDRLVSRSDFSKAKVIYYYCDYADQRTLQTTHIFGTLLQQLLGGHIPKDLETQMIGAFQNGRHVPATDTILRLVCSAMNENAVTFIILDGLDECDRAAQEDIMTLLNQLEALQKTAAKVFITCRDEDQILRSLPQFSRIHVTAATVNRDIECFIAGSVQSRIANGKLKVRSPGMEQEIVSELTSKAQGM